MRIVRGENHRISCRLLVYLCRQSFCTEYSFRFYIQWSLLWEVITPADFSPEILSFRFTFSMETVTKTICLACLKTTRIIVPFFEWSLFSESIYIVMLCLIATERTGLISSAKYVRKNKYIEILVSFRCCQIAMVTMTYLWGKTSV